MTTANKITIFRIALIPVFIAAAIFYGQSVERGSPIEWLRWVAILTFLVAGISDGIDGYIARHYHQISSLGVILDPIADKSLMLVTILTLSLSSWSSTDAEYAKFPIWFPVIVITRDVILVVGAIILRLIRGMVRVKSRWTGKVATFFQISAIACLMLQLRFIPLHLIVVLAGIFTSVSGIHYIVDGVRQLRNHQSSTPRT
jgi:cardiolipin synthase (CMP-forming)